MSNEPSSSNSLKICDLCNVQSSRYCCPRCNVLYCSLDCYKSEKHLSCSESFYRECINEELASQHSDEESRRRMVAILKKMREDDFDLEQIENLDPADNDFVPNEDGFNPLREELLEEMDSDDEEATDLHERIKGLDLDDADAVWNVLTEDEKNEFQALLSQGDIGNILDQWQPWWLYSKDATLVQEVEDEKEVSALKNCPKFIDVPKFSTLSKVPPSPAIRFNITNILASYAFVMRYFNGEIEPIECTACLLSICDNLDNNRNFDDMVTALESVKQKCLLSSLVETDEASIDVMKRDTFFLLQGPSEENKLHYCRAALSELYAILKRAKSASKPSKSDEKSIKLPKINDKSMKTSETTKGTFSKKFPDHKGDHLPNLDLNKLKKCIKKVEFYLSFVESCGMDFDEGYI